MTPEERRRREEDPNVKYLKKKICDYTGEKSFVFISYKSDDWEVVLSDIVYRLVKDYNLNVYFDGSFDLHNSLWITQFPKNMCDYKCKGVIAFFDDKYATSYATLMELLYSQTKKAALGKPDSEGLPIVPVDLGKLTNIEGKSGAKDTNLGVEIYGDGSVNVNAANELELFTESFTELVERKVLKGARYIWKKDDQLTAIICSTIVREIKAYKKINENYYSPGMTLEGIVGSIRNACGPEVFSEDTSRSEAVQFRAESDVKEKREKEPAVIESTDSKSEKSEPIINDGNVDTAKHNNDISYPSQDINKNVCKTEISLVSAIDENTSLAQFEKMCESIDFCERLRVIRKKKRGGAQLFDYLMAALLRGCDTAIESNNVILRKGAYNYCAYAISENVDLENIKLGASQYTWTSNARKAMRKEDMPENFFNAQGKVKSGQLGKYSTIFEALPSDMTIGCVIDKFKQSEEGFNTKDNDTILEAWELIKSLDCNTGKEGIGELLAD